MVIFVDNPMPGAVVLELVPHNQLHYPSNFYQVAYWSIIVWLVPVTFLVVWVDKMELPSGAKMTFSYRLVDDVK